jgi:hypothetical protein
MLSRNEVNKKSESPQWELSPRHSRLQRSASTNCATAYPTSSAVLYEAEKKEDPFEVFIDEEVELDATSPFDPSNRGILVHNTCIGKKKKKKTIFSQHSSLV